MAFGGMANYNAVQQALQALLQRTQGQGNLPIPAVSLPVGGLGPLNLDTTAAQAALQPEPVPPALPGPVDAQGIINQYLATIDQAPTPPTVAPRGRLERIASALQGFGAGVQGQGPQFLARLQEQRDRPQREYERRLERFQDRQSQVALAGTQAAQRAEERREERVSSLLEAQGERDFNKWLKSANIKDANAREAARRAWELEQDRVKAEAAAKVAVAKAEEDQRKEVRTQANTFFDDYKSDGISRGQATRFAEFEVRGTPLPAADRKVYDRTVKTSKEGGTTPSGTNKLSQFEILKGQLQAAITRGDTVGQNRIRARLDNLMTHMPSNIEVGYEADGQTPFARVKGAQPPRTEDPSGPYQGPPTQAAQQTQAPQMSRAEAKAKLKANGYSDAEADKELNRLGIK